MNLTRCHAASAFFATFAALTAGALTEYSVTYVPQSGDGPWEWSTVENWKYNSKPYNALERLPAANRDNGYVDTFAFYAEACSIQPLRVSAGTHAECLNFYIGIGEHPDNVTPASVNPVMFEVCGGTVTNQSAAKVAWRTASYNNPRSAKLKISSGEWTSLDAFYFAGANRMAWFDIGETGRFNVPNNGFYVGSSNQGGGIVTNAGTIFVRNMYLGFDGATDAVTGTSFTTGIVVNASSGTLMVTNDLVLAHGNSSYAVIENHGTLNVGRDLLIGNKSGAESEFINHGALTIGRRMRVGYAEGGVKSVYRHKKGASLVKNIVSGDSYQALYIGGYAPGLFSVDGGDLDLPSNANQNRVFLGSERSKIGTFEVKNGGTFHFGGTAFTVGYGNCATGILHIAGQGSKMYGDGWINVGNWWSYDASRTNGVGEITVSDGGELDVSAVYLGFGGGSRGTLTVANGGTARIRSTLSIGHVNAVGKAGMTGTVVVAGNDSAITNVRETTIGCASERNFGLLKMEGGKYFFKTESDSKFDLGKDGNSSSGEIRGWGRISHNGLKSNQSMPSDKVYMKHYGKVIADGEGVERDLDMRFMWSVDPALSNSVINAVGCNGWYARNKGRLLMPILYHYSERGFKKCVGEQEKYSGDPRLVNSMKISFTDMWDSLYSIWAYLYAPDRSDIPTGLSSHIGSGKALAVYRLGYFSDKYNLGEPANPARWTGAKIKFHYDPVEASEYSRVRVFRHDGTASGSWKRIGNTEASTSTPFIETEEFSRIEDADPSGAIWNIGWFAVVANNPSGAVIIIK